LAHPKKELKLWKLPENKRFYGKMECRPLQPTYTIEKGRGGLWAKHIWD
jgi:hypothetical protein